MEKQKLRNLILFGVFIITSTVIHTLWKSDWFNQ